jgi:hypothetical protein
VVLPLPWGEGWGEGEGIIQSFTVIFSAVGYAEAEMAFKSARTFS